MKVTPEPLIVAQLSFPGPAAHPHQFSVALTVPLPRLFTSILWALKLLRWRSSGVLIVIIYLISGDEILVCGSGVVAYQDAPEL
jgi:hypothetical protein